MATATLERPPTTQTTGMAFQTSEDAAVRAVNQLLSLIVGRDAAIATAELKHNPKARLAKVLELALLEYQVAGGAAVPAEERAKAIRQVQRKLDSLESLRTLVDLIEEVEW